MPKELGGSGMSFLDHYTIFAELARNDASLFTFAGVHNSLGEASILFTGGEEIK